MQKEGPENKYTRMPLIQQLIEMGWDINQMQYSPEWVVPKTPSEASKREKKAKFQGFPVDLVIFDSAANLGDYRHILIIAETKKPDVLEGINQLEIYLALEPYAKMGIWTNGHDIATVHKTIDGQFKINFHGRLPYPEEDLTADAERPLTWNDLRTNVKSSELTMVFYDLLCVIVSEDTKSTRPDDRLNNLCNILLAKIESDKIAKAEPDKPVRFQYAKNRKETAQRIKDLFRDLLISNRDSFDDENEQIMFDDSTITKCVFELAKYQIFGLSSETVSTAFQVFRQDNLKSDDGQYYTPLPIITNAVRLLQIKMNDKVIDPACGTGGFLLESFISLKENYPAMDDGDAKGWAQRHLFGVDKDKINIKLTKAIMLTIGDGSTNTFHGDSIRSYLWESMFPYLAINLRQEMFTCILTNPPFGKNLKLSANDGKLVRFEVSHKDSKEHLILGKEEYTERELGITFVERCHKLLVPGGKIGIVLPETYFFSDSYLWFQEWIHQHYHLRAIINIPMEAFQGFCRAKTNLYIMEKKGGSRTNLTWVREGKVLVINSKTCGINKDGNELYWVDPETGERDYSRLDDQLSEDCKAVLQMSDIPHGCYIPLDNIIKSSIAIPMYYSQEYEMGIKSFCENNGFDRMSIGDLYQQMMIEIFHGHGSPSADQRIGDVPYIKVSDLRAGTVNVNPTNQIPITLAQKYWKGKTSGLQAYDLLSPERASKNIGEFCVLMPGQEQIVLTKEVIGLRSKSDLFDQFYLMWAMNLPVVRRQWERVIFMQTNREDVGDRFLEIEIPIPKSKEKALSISKPYKTYYDSVTNLKKTFEEDKKNLQALFR